MQVKVFRSWTKFRYYYALTGFFLFFFHMDQGLWSLRGEVATLGQENYY